MSKKGVVKLEYRIDTDSAIVTPDQTIFFILNEDTEKEIKKYIFRWSPFSEDKKKEVKKREIMGAHQFDLIKLYPFDRLLTFKGAKGNNEMYDPFGNAPDSKSQMILLDFQAKKIGDYELSGDIKEL